MKDSRADHEFSRALGAVDGGDHGLIEKVKMLVEPALGAQRKHPSPKRATHDVSPFDRAFELCLDVAFAPGKCSMAPEVERIGHRARLAGNEIEVRLS